MMALVLSAIVSVPLGDGDFRDYLYTSPNQLGVEIDFYTDALTGANPFRAAIPNPPLVLAWPAGWGHTAPVYYRPVYPLPVDPPTLPEPGTVALLAAGLSVLAWRLR